MAWVKAFGITLIFMAMFFPLTINGIWTCPVALFLQAIKRRLGV
jgi:hypothetical protein